MIKSYNLDGGLVGMLDERARLSGRSSSKELEMILKTVLGWAEPSLGLDGVVATKEILVDDSNVRDISEKLDGGKAIDFEPNKGMVVPVPTRPFRSFMKGEKKGKFEGVSKLAEKIAKEVPGVKVASEVKLPLKPGIHPMDEVTKSAKKRPKGTGEEVELVKGFWREKFDCVGDAMIEAQQKGWKEGEYQIKPIA